MALNSGSITSVVSSAKNLEGSLSPKLKLTGELTPKKDFTGNIMATVLKGLDAYEIAKLNGFTGTVEEWLSSLHGEGIQIEVLEDTSDAFVIKIFNSETEVITPNLRTAQLRPMTFDEIDEIIEEVSDNGLFG